MAKNPLLKQQVLMANRGKIKIKKPKKWLYPMAAERSYQKQLVAINKIFYDKVKENIIPQLPSLVAQAKSLRPDSVDSRLDASWVDQLQQLTNSTYIDYQSTVTPNKISNITSEQADKISLMNKEQFVKTIQSSLSVNPIMQEPYLETQLKIFQNQNTDLITKLGSDQKERVQQTLYSNLSQGNGIEKIQEELSKAEGIGENRARLIARDQTNKFNGQLTQLRQQELGITSYVWTTAQDERVRPTHKVLDGEVFTWEKGPKIGHPGSEINCRCIAQPVITDAMFDTDGSVPIVEQEQKPKVETAISSIEGFDTPSKLKTLKYSDKFNEYDKMGLSEYQSGVYSSNVGGYVNIQSYLRNNQPAWQGMTLTGVKTFVDKIDDAILKGKLVKDTIAYRGIKHGQYYVDLKIGDTFSDKGYFSTSTDKKVASKFAEKLNRDERPVLFKVIGSKGTNAVYLPDEDAFTKEAEILFKRNQEFKILKKTNKGNYWQIDIQSI